MRGALTRLATVHCVEKSVLLAAFGKVRSSRVWLPKPTRKGDFVVSESDASANSFKVVMGEEAFSLWQRALCISCNDQLVFAFLPFPGILVGSYFRGRPL